MSLYKKLLKRSKALFGSESYELFNNLDELPIWNWNKCIEEQDIKYIYKANNYSLPMELTKECIDTFDYITNEYYDKYLSQNEEYQYVLDKQKESILYKIKAILDNDKTNLIFANMADAELEAKNSTKKTINLTQNIAHIEKYLGFKLKPKEVSVNEYFSYIDLMHQEWQRK